MRVMGKGLLLLGLVAMAGLAFASDEVDQTSPYLIASSRVSPSYPPAAQAARWEGTVVLAAQVRTDGTVGDIEVVDSTHRNLGFEEAAMSAMKEWRFEPAMSNGQAVEAVSVFRLAFNIPGTRNRNYPYVAGNQLVSSLAAPGVAAKPMAFVGDNFSPAASEAREKVLTMGRPPSCQGCMYDRRDLFPSPLGGANHPNVR